MGKKKKEQEPAVKRCPNCGAEVSEYGLGLCVICRGSFCYDCAITGYGRDFCSKTCRDFFFHGDSDDLGGGE